MGIFFRYILSYFKADFKLLPHLVLALFLAITITINYHYNFYDNLTAQYYTQPASVFVLWCFYSFAFLSATAIISAFQTENKLLFNKKFVFFGLLGIVFLSLDTSYYLLQFMRWFLPENQYIAHWLKACLSNFSSLITLIIPLYIIYFSVKYFKPEFFGFRLNGAKVSNYLWLILFMIPLIYLASCQPDFLETYPTYDDNFEYKFLNVEQWLTVGVYEFSYGFDFISVELFFRGFLVVALSRFAGKDAVLVMVVVYAFLHFGKPAGETVSSIFGGYILGILAFSSRNIFGGLIAHLGVAWGMEYFAYLQS